MLICAVCTCVKYEFPRIETNKTNKLVVHPTRTQSSRYVYYLKNCKTGHIIYKYKFDWNLTMYFNETVCPILDSNDFTFYRFTAPKNIILLYDLNNFLINVTGNRNYNGIDTTIDLLAIFSIFIVTSLTISILIIFVIRYVTGYRYHNSIDTIIDLLVKFVFLIVTLLMILILIFYAISCVTDILTEY